MKCILLCAGYATRLFPLTENFPKALLKVGGKAIIDYTLEKVNKIDEIDAIYLVTNAKYTKHFEDWAKEKNNVKPITVFNDGTFSNDDRLGAIGDIQFVVDNAKIDDDILVLADYNELPEDVIEGIKESGIHLWWVLDSALHRGWLLL